LSCKKPRKSTQVRHSLCEVSRIMHMFANKNLLYASEINHIKVPNYPSSPSRKRCVLDVAYSIWIGRVEAKVLSTPPGKYGRKAET